MLYSPITAEPVQTAAPAVVRRWKKFLGVSCSHAKHVDPDAWKAMLDFKRSFNPDFTVHFGDYCDTGALRSGRSQTEKADAIRPDIETGLRHLHELEPNLVLDGNHDERPYRFLESRDEAVAFTAETLVTLIRKEVTQRIKAEHVLYEGIWSGRMLGNWFLTHGTIYNENACRDMAEMYACQETLGGGVMFGHTHTMGTAMGRSMARIQGVNIGCLCSAPNMDYAKNRRKTMSWTTGWVYGEYCDNECRPKLFRFKSPSLEFRPRTAEHS
jgi:predicted phosphodiesterase